MYSSYSDLCREIEIHQKIIEGAQKNIKYYQGLLHSSKPKDYFGISFDDIPGGGSKYMPLDRILDNIRRNESMIYLETCIIENLEKAKKEIDVIMKQFKGIEYQVFYLMSVENLTQAQIAEKLDRSERQINRICSNIKRKQKQEALAVNT